MKKNFNRIYKDLIGKPIDLDNFSYGSFYNEIVDSLPEVTEHIDDYSIRDLSYFYIVGRFVNDEIYIANKVLFDLIGNRLLIRVKGSIEIDDNVSFGIYALIIGGIPFVDGANLDVFQFLSKKGEIAINRYFDGIRNGYVNFELLKSNNIVIPYYINIMIDRVFNESFAVWERFCAEKSGTGYSWIKYLQSSHLSFTDLLKEMDEL